MAYRILTVVSSLLSLPYWILENWLFLIHLDSYSFIVDTFCFLKSKCDDWAGERTPLLEFLPCKQEVLSLSPQNPFKHVGIAGQSAASKCLNSLSLKWDNCIVPLPTRLGKLQ